MILIKTDRTKADMIPNWKIKKLIRTKTSLANKQILFSSISFIETRTNYRYQFRFPRPCHQGT